MTNYIGKTRTNYFAVKDLDKFEDLMQHCVSDDYIRIYKSDENDGKVGFICNGSLEGIFLLSPEDIDNVLENWTDYLDEEQIQTLNALKEAGGGYITQDLADEIERDPSYDDFIAELQKLLPSDDACIITEVGSEGMRYLAGGACVITKDKHESFNINTIAVDTARKLLGNADWKTKNEC